MNWTTFQFHPAPHAIATTSNGLALAYCGAKFATDSAVETHGRPDEDERCQRCQAVTMDRAWQERGLAELVRETEVRS